MDGSKNKNKTFEENLENIIFYVKLKKLYDKYFN
jgi:hypothetical protein